MTSYCGNSNGFLICFKQ